MLYVALALAVAIAVVAITFASVIRWLIRQHARERDLLINQLLNLAGRPWRDPPRFDQPIPSDDETIAFPEFVYTPTPEQLPD